jgi:hypothetical protein
MIWILVYVIGFIVTAYIRGPRDAAGEKDTAGQAGIALMWPILAVFFLMMIPVFLVQLINTLRKEE